MFSRLFVGIVMILLAGLNAQTAYTEFRSNVDQSVQVLASRPVAWVEVQASLQEASQQCTYFKNQVNEVSTAKSNLKDLKFYTNVMGIVLGGSFKILDTATAAVIAVLNSVELMLSGILTALKLPCLMADTDSTLTVSEVRKPLESIQSLLLQIDNLNLAASWEAAAASGDKKLTEIRSSLDRSGDTLRNIVVQLTDRTGRVKTKMQQNPAKAALQFLAKLNRLVDYKTFGVSLRGLMGQGQAAFQQLLENQKSILKSIPSNMIPSFDAAVPFIPIPTTEFSSLAVSLVDPSTMLGSPGDVGKRLWALYAELASELPIVINSLRQDNPEAASGLLSQTYPFKTTIPITDSNKIQAFATIAKETEIEVYCNSKLECTQLNAAATERAGVNIAERCTLPNGKFVGIGFRTDLSCQCAFELSNGVSTQSYQATCQVDNLGVSLDQPIPACMYDEATCPDTTDSEDIGGGLSGGAVAGVVMATLLGLGIVAFGIKRHRDGKSLTCNCTETFRKEKKRVPVARVGVQNPIRAAQAAARANSATARQYFHKPQNIV